MRSTVKIKQVSIAIRAMVLVERRSYEELIPLLTDGKTPTASYPE